MSHNISRIERLFSTQKAYIGYLTAGDGGIKKTLSGARALIAGGVNCLEIGVPFSDPVADGPVIQQAAERALAQDTNMRDILWLIQQIRLQSEIPLILFSYYNPILSTLKTHFLRDAKCAGVDGLLIVDCPYEESMTLREACGQLEIDVINIITPSTDKARIEKIVSHAKGFIYYACRSGTTGLRNRLPDDLLEKLTLIKHFTSMPVVVGFGISSQAMADAVIEQADGVVVGSLFVKHWAESSDPASLLSLAHSLKPQLLKN